MNNFYISVVTYLSILTSVISLSSSAVDVLFLQVGTGQELNLDLGRTTSVSEGNIPSYILVVVLSSLFIICPKIILYSWTMSVFRWEGAIFLACIALFIFCAKGIGNGIFAREGKSRANKVKKTFVSTVIGILGVEPNPNCSITVLSLLSILIIILLVGMLPYKRNKLALQLDPSANLTFYGQDTDDQQGICICRNMSSELNAWQNKYFMDGMVCKKQ